MAVAFPMICLLSPTDFLLSLLYLPLTYPPSRMNFLVYYNNGDVRAAPRGTWLKASSRCLAKFH